MTLFNRAFNPKKMIKYYCVLMIFLLFSSCKPEKKPDRFSQPFRDRFVCECIMKGLDSFGLDPKVQALSYSDWEAWVLFDTTINQMIPDALRLIYYDSLGKVGRVAENGQGYDVYKVCLDYSRSKKMDSVISERKKFWDTIKNIEQYVSDRMLY
jgi:hypothetical protein